MKKTGLLIAIVLGLANTIGMWQRLYFLFFWLKV